MDIAEFTIFLMLQIFLLVYGIQKKAIVLNAVGIITALFLMPFTVANLVVQYVYYVNPSTGILTQTNTYADATTICIIFILLIFLHFIVILREWKS